MKTLSFTAISPIDGRYQNKVKELQPIFSEYGLIRNRLFVEIKWLDFLTKEVKGIASLSKKAKMFLSNILLTFDETQVQRIKDIEKITNHDVKAVEYFIKEKIAEDPELKKLTEMIHFASTSEDTNNLAYNLMLKEGINILKITMQEILNALTEFAHAYADQPMLARTHGQPATPTTFGKEMANFVARLRRQLDNLNRVPLLGKMNGCVGNYNAHIAAFPDLDWLKLSKKFVTSLGLAWNQYTTQIESHDGMIELFNVLSLFNAICLDLTRDIWGYVSLNYLQQKVVTGEVGSSTMPHKVNPIDFENAEGNLGIANALLSHFAAKLPISRWQRDLSDSTVLRNIGVVFSHSLLAYKSILSGLAKIQVNVCFLNEELNNHWEVLAEALQTVMRKYDIDEPYERLKEFTRGKKIDKKSLHNFIDGLKLPQKVKNNLKQLTPANYIGNAALQAKKV